MDTKRYRETPAEQERIADLLAIIPAGHSILDVGARDGYLSCLLTTAFEHVTALDLEKPQITCDGVTPVAGDATCLEFPDNHFDAVLCAEVLEHIPPRLLQKACDEITRVVRHNVLIGVPYMQDTRVNRTTCRLCGKRNPPWGHVNVFDENRLKRLFPRLGLERVSFVEESRSKTNCVSCFLMDLAGNPYGTYNQEERCVFCGQKLMPPPERTFVQKAFTKAAFMIQSMQQPFISPHPAWLHALLTKQ